MSSPSELSSELKAEAARLGLDLCGISSLPAHGLPVEACMRWLADGCHGDMAWMERNGERRYHPENLLPGARSLVVVGINYFQPRPASRGRISLYALGRDYHDVLLKRLKTLCTWLREHGGDNRPYVDTGPVLEKPLAAIAGLGWQGKSTILVHPRMGTWLLLGVIATTLELAPDTPSPSRCGSCDRCLRACPTGAITAPWRLDARRCLAYLTIEHKGPIPLEFREALGNRVFGCDDCLDACPWNRWATLTRESRFHARPVPDLRETLAWTDPDFAACFAGTPVKRLGLARWLRNACVVLGNIGTPADLDALRPLLTHPDALVAEHATWAAGRIRQRHTG